MLRILSLGAGVQSTTVLLMSIHGGLPKLDAAVFADTGWEPRAVYAHLNWLEIQAHNAGIPVHRVTKGNIREDALRSCVRGTVNAEGQRWAALPYRTVAPDGTVGMIRRQCTTEYKIVPLERKMRELLGYKPRQRIPPGSLELWFGISFEERRRMRLSAKKWKDHYYPLVDHGIDREGCHEWMDRHGYPRAPRSACIGCPYRSPSEWRELRDASPEEWEDACEFDEAIRKTGGLRGDCFIFRGAVPLRTADLRNDVDHGQGLLWREECAGLCGV